MAPAAAQRFEYRDLILYQCRVGSRDGRVGGDQHLFRGQQIEGADRAGQEFSVCDVECTMSTGLCVGHRLSVIER